MRASVFVLEMNPFQIISRTIEQDEASLYFEAKTKKIIYDIQIQSAETNPDGTWSVGCSSTSVTGNGNSIDRPSRSRVYQNHGRSEKHGDGNVHHEEPPHLCCFRTW